MIGPLERALDRLHDSDHVLARATVLVARVVGGVAFAALILIFVTEQLARVAAAVESGAWLQVGIEAGPLLAFAFIGYIIIFAPIPTILPRGGRQ